MKYPRSFISLSTEVDEGIGLSMIPCQNKG